MATPINVLLVDDDQNSAESILGELTSFGYKPALERVETSGEMAVALLKKRWDIVLSNHNPPFLNALSLLSLIKKTDIDIPFIIVSSTLGAEEIVSAVKAGAHDCIMKNNLHRLPPTVEREMEEAKMRQAQKRGSAAPAYFDSYNPTANLPNRSLFDDRLQKALARGKREEKPIAVMVIDVDRFREINETLGHRLGNFLLQQIGLRFQETLREADTVSYFGEDTFSIILPNSDIKGAIHVAQKIQHLLEKPFVIENVPVHVDVSMGISVYPDHGDNIDDLIHKADTAMYLAKESEDDYVIYTPEKDRHSIEQLALVGELSQGIETNQLVLHYQPKINLKTTKIIGVEALVRWQHPKHGLLNPKQFLPLAERTGLIKSLALWTLHTAIRQLASWQNAGLELPITVNLAMRNLHDGEMDNKITEWLKTYAVLPDRLRLEFSESAIMADPIRAEKRLSCLKQVGIGISIDDFGIGYSALSSLQKLPINELKVDQSFIGGMMENETDYVLASSLIDMGQNLGLTTVAEGVENEAIFKRLSDFGCDIAQGYYISWPLPADQLIQWISEAPYQL